MRSHIVFIDFENVQPESFDHLLPEHFRVLVFVGASQTKIPFDVAASLQKLGSRAEYIKITGNGSNALDFHIAYYIGIHSAAEPDAHFHIVSKDAGFDPLVQHLKSKQVCARRVNSISGISAVKPPNTKSPEERVLMFVERLGNPKTSKPRNLKSLSNSVASFFKRQLSDDEVSAVIAGMVQQGAISLDGNTVVYANQANSNSSDQVERQLTFKLAR